MYQTGNNAKLKTKQMKIYEKNRTRAIKECLRLLRIQTGLAKIKKYSFNHYSAQCECGESNSIVVTKGIGNEYIQKQVIICDVCYKKNK